MNAEEKSKLERFTAKDENGNIINYETLFTFELEETKKNYIVYTDNSVDEDDGTTRVFASIYDPNEEEINLIPIETDYEWSKVEEILDELQREIAAGNIDNVGGE